MPADQALGMVSFGLMQRLAQDGQVELPWLETPRNAEPVSYTHLRAHETRGNIVCRLLLEKKKRARYAL